MCAHASEACSHFDQEPDDCIVARRCSGKALEKTSPKDIIGFAGDTVRERPLYSISSPCSSSPSTEPLPSLVQDGEVHASNNVGTITIPRGFLNQTKESKEAAKELTAEATKSGAKADAKAEAKDEAALKSATKAEQTTEKSAAVKLAGPKLKVKKLSLIHI